MINKASRYIKVPNISNWPTVNRVIISVKQINYSVCDI